MALSGGLYHVGIVVPDVETAQAHFTELLGIEWGPVLVTEAFDIRDGEGLSLIHISEPTRPY